MQVPAFQLALQLRRAAGLSGRNLFDIAKFIGRREKGKIPLGNGRVILLHIGHDACGLVGKVIEARIMEECFNGGVQEENQEQEGVNGFFFLYFPEET
jgi:hypothetical protein